MAIKEIKWQEVGAQVTWADTLATPIEMELMRDTTIRGVRAMFTSYVAAGGPSIGYMKTPLSWWDHWKAEHPRLAKYMESPMYRTEKHEFFSRICPHVLHLDGVSSTKYYPSPRTWEHFNWVGDLMPDAVDIVSSAPVYPEYLSVKGFVADAETG